MTSYTPRCPHCASSIDASVGFWSRLRFWAEHSVYCPTCSRTTTARNSQIMGDAYGRWSLQFSGQIQACAHALPVIAQVEARRIMGTKVSDEDVKLLQSLDALVHTCLRQARPILIQQAHGQDAQLEVAPLSDPHDPGARIAAVLGRSSIAAGEREWQLFFARVGRTQYVIYAPPPALPIETRVRDAIHGRHRPMTHA